MTRLLLSTALCLMLSFQAQAFFDGFDIFKQGFQEFNDRTFDQSHRLEEELRHVFEEPVFKRIGESAGGNEDVEFLEPEEQEVPIPGFTHHEGFPGGFFNMFSHGLRGGSRGPWWKGENVCVEREEIDESHRNSSTSSSNSDYSDEDDVGVSGMFGSFEFSSCQQTDIKYTCTTRISSHGVKKKFVVKYQCCHGFTRKQGKQGCVAANLKGLLPTAEDLGAKDFVKVVKTSGLEDKLSTENLTMFAPTDDALRDFMDKMQQENQVEFFVPPAEARRRRRRSVETADMKEVALGHVTKGFIDIGEVVNEQILYSEYNNSTLRMNVYPTLGESRVTCNCARVTSVNNMATNGIVHLVDQVIRPVTKTLAELLEQDEELISFTQMLRQADMLTKLMEPGHTTLFAPTEMAFKKLPAATMERLKDGHSCLHRVLQHHILPHVLCSAAINGHVTTYNMAGDVLHLERRYDDNKLFLEDVQIVMHDVMATNGVIHVIDDVIVPDSAKPLSEVLRSANHTIFLDLLNSTSLLDELDAMENVTVFAPTDKALEDDKEAVDEMRGNEDKLREVLLYHTTSPEKMSCDLTNDMKLETRAGEGKSLRINLYASQPMFMGVRHRATAQCARLVGVDTRACGGVVHAVDRLIVPPTMSVLELVKNDKRFTSLFKLIKAADMESVLEETTTITLLAPTNDAFERVGEEGLNILLADKELSAKVLRQHILPAPLCCAGVSGNSWPFTNRVETLNRDSITVRRDSDGDVHIGTTTVRECDKMATNGLVHVVNRVMGRWRNGGANAPPPSNSRIGLIHPNLQVMLYGLKDLGL